MKLQSLVVLLIAALFHGSLGFTGHARLARATCDISIASRTRSQVRVQSTEESARIEVGQEMKRKVEELLAAHRVLLFMKGTREQPRCGFSNKACRILDLLNISYATVNILEDQELRQGLKEYSSWPTYPQLYVDGQLVGGSDIMQELYQRGELAQLVGKDEAKPR